MGIRIIDLSELSEGSVVVSGHRPATKKKPGRKPSKKKTPPKRRKKKKPLTRKR